jgi:putative membrane protein
MSYRMAITVSAAALALTAACKTQSDQTGTTRTTSATPEPTTATPMTATPTTPTAAPAAPSGHEMSSSDRDFITKAAQGSMLEVALGSDASQKGMSPAVKQFGDRMVKDHGKADSELKELAAKKGITLPTELDDEHKKEIQKFAKLSGKEFDAEYSKLMVDDHQSDVKDFQKESKDAKDPDLRNWAASKVPVLEQHLSMANSMKSKTAR